MDLPFPIFKGKIMSYTNWSIQYNSKKSQRNVNAEVWKM